MRLSFVGANIRRDFSDVTMVFVRVLVADALRAVDAELKAGYTWVVAVDIRGYFDNIDHGKLPRVKYCGCYSLMLRQS